MQEHRRSSKVLIGAVCGLAGVLLLVTGLLVGGMLDRSEPVEQAPAAAVLQDDDQQDDENADGTEQSTATSGSAGRTGSGGSTGSSRPGGPSAVFVTGGSSDGDEGDATVNDVEVNEDNDADENGNAVEPRNPSPDVEDNGSGIEPRNPSPDEEFAEQDGVAQGDDEEQQAELDSSEPGRSPPTGPSIR